MQLTLNQKLTVGVCGIVIGTILATMLTGSYSTFQAIESKTRKDLLKAKKVFEFIQETRFRELLINNQTISEIPHLKVVITTAEIDHATILDTIRDINQNVQSDIMVVYDAKGKLLASTRDPQRHGDDMSGDTIVKKVLKGESFSGIKTIGRDVYQLVATPFLYGDQVVGVLLLGYSIDQQIISSLAEMTNSEIALVSKDAINISSSKNIDFSVLGHDIVTADWDESKQVSTKMIDDEKYLLLTVPLDKNLTQGYYIMARSLDQELGFYHRLQKKLLLIGVVILIVALAFSMIHSNQIARPIQNLVEGTQRIAGGDFTSPVKITSKDEIGQLAQSFNTMTDNLVEHLEREKLLAAEAATAEASKKRAEELEVQREKLENEVKERKQAERALELVNKDLENNAQQMRIMYQDLKQTNEKLKDTQTQLFQAERLETVGRLATGVAHEVKNPLMMIMQNIEYIGKKIPQKDENAKLALENTKIAVHRADSVIKGLLDFSSLSEIRRDNINLNEIIESSLLLVKHEFDKNKVDVKKDLADDIPKVNIDRLRIEQVIVNLLVNAAQALGDGGSVIISSCVSTLAKGDSGVGNRAVDPFREGDRAICIKVEDNGPGIPEKVLHKIYDPFFTTKRSKEGTGLGLSVIKNIIDLHEGHIIIENREEGGARAVVMFKAALS